MNQPDHQNNGFTEGDWRLFSSKIGGWQENYMNRLNEEYLKILMQNTTPSEKFWAIEKRIKIDKKKVGVTIDLRRSTMLMNILELLNDKVIEMDDLIDFSDTLKETIKLYQKR